MECLKCYGCQYAYNNNDNSRNNVRKKSSSVVFKNKAAFFSSGIKYITKNSHHTQLAWWAYHNTPHYLTQPDLAAQRMLPPLWFVTFYPISCGALG